MGRFRAVLTLGVALLAVLSSASARSAGLQNLDVEISPIENFKIGSSETKFGRLEFVGGLEMTSSGADFGAFSAFRFLDGGSQFVGVADTGFWFAGRVERDALGKPSGISDFKMNAVQNIDGSEDNQKWHTDAEGMVIVGDRVTASFERVHRIASGVFDFDTLTTKLTSEKLPVAKSELRNNRGFETLALSPSDSPLAGARVAVTEKSLNKKGDIFAAVMEGPKKGVFFVARNGEFDITDGDFLPNGDLLLLERSFNMAQGVAMRLRVIAGDKIEPGATVDGAVLLESNMAYQIDNMECLDVWQDAEGVSRITLISDDNHSILQRNVLLEFKLTN